ncbi:MAG: GAF domain-containing protein [Armatimonadia bacterium]|nr:GAF domain-containing protein [Armatimonadia bacterium]
MSDGQSMGYNEVTAELSLRRRQLDAVRTITAAVYSTTDLQELIRECLDGCLEVVGCEAGSVILHDEETGQLVFQHVVGPKSAELVGMRMDADQGIAGRVFRTGQYEVSDDVQSDPEHYRAVGEKIDLVTRTMVTVPLKNADNETIGVMQVLNRRGGPFGDQDMDVLLIVANQAAMAIDHARLHQEARLAQVVKLIGDIAHDVKNFMTPVTSGVKTLQMIFDQTMMAVPGAVESSSPECRKRILEVLKPLQEFFPEAVTMVMDGADQVTGRAREIADCIKGQVSEPHFEQASVDDIIRSVAKVLRIVADRADITLDLSGLGDPPPLMVDRKLIHSAVYNLVNNAIPETPRGGRISVSTSCQPEGEFPEGGYVQIVVSDTGKGIPEHVRSKLFTSQAVSTKPGGTGLGTRIVRNAVDAHGGIVTVDSEEGEGSRFELRVPF